MQVCIERIERNVKAAAKLLGVGLFDGPEAKQRVGLLRFGKGL